MTTKDSLEKAANEWRDGAIYTSPSLQDAFIAGAEWERERAKVLESALAYYSDKGESVLTTNPDTAVLGVISEGKFSATIEWKDIGHLAREALAKYRGET